MAPEVVKLETALGAFLMLFGWGFAICLSSPPGGGFISGNWGGLNRKVYVITYEISDLWISVGIFCENNKEIRMIYLLNNLFSVS